MGLRTQSDKRWPAYASALFALAVVATLCLWLTRGWAAIGVPHFDPLLIPFSDAENQLAPVEWCKAGRGEWVGGVCFVPSQADPTHAQTYEPWVTLGEWGLASAHYDAIALAMIALFYLAFCLTMKPASAGELGLCLLLLATPAVQLGVERGNFDMLMNALICLAAWLLARPRPLAAAAGCLVLAIATMLKLYTGLACAFAWIVARTLRASTAIAAVAATVLAVAVLGPETIVVLGQGAPEGATRFSTGAHWLFRYRGIGSAVGTILFAAAVTGGMFAMLKQVPAPHFERWPNRKAAFDLAYLVAVPLFFLKDSYDYRFIVWLPCLALPLALLRGGVHDRWRAWAAATLALFLVATVTELPSHLLDLHALRSDTAWTAPAISALVCAKQAATWVLVGMLSLGFGFGLTQKLPGFARQRPPR